MLGINSNINSLVAQQNLTSSGSALSQAITRLSSGKRINSAADDAAGLAISNIMQTQINGLNQGVSNSNDGTSMTQTASSGLSSLTSSLQRIRELATQASNGSMTADDRAALQQEVNQQVAEVNRIASQTTYNGMNLLNGSMGNVSFQVGANVGQTISLNLSQNMSAANLGTGLVQAGNTLGTYSNLALASDGNAASTGSEITSVTASMDSAGNIKYTDQSGNDITSNTAVVTASGIDTTSLTAGGSVSTSGLELATDGSAYTEAAITAINVISDGNGGFTYTDQNNQALSSDVVTTLGFSTSAGSVTSGAESAAQSLSVTIKDANGNSEDSVTSQINALNTPDSVAKIDITTQSGANMAMESIDNALNSLNNLQATIGAAQNRFSAIGTTQQAQATDLSTAQSSIQDANFAQETANLSKAQVLQQAGISVLAQANSQPQQILKLLQ
ncbi:flagellin N-terminal helical domain-containing protein [Paraburkholderia lycopersici]|uniref:Flagellin n=1 Tax=Paraburkholderia lycopersici TaxID=416944 RepID=A0A1G6T5M0_9BURK|nr:flagellin [Paraburkholderia lycopersici]SDD24184.1 flagellin [Paraburkholderia lycopersici]